MFVPVELSYKNLLFPYGTWQYYDMIPYNNK